MKQIMIDKEEDSYKRLKELSFKKEARRTAINQSNGLINQERERTIIIDINIHIRC